jgi:hypothetical protein
LLTGSFRANVPRLPTNEGSADMKFSLAIACTAGLAVAAPAQLTASPWFGTWKLRLSDPGEKPETLIYSDAGGGAMRMVSVESKSMIVTKFDGKPAADMGEGAAKGNARRLCTLQTQPSSVPVV